MATIVRVKRRRNEDPLESIVISCKRKKEENYPLANSLESEPQSSLKFAGTVASKVEGVSRQIRDAIRKEKLQKEYKQHTVNITSKNRQRQKQSSQNSRLKIISSLRNIELDRLDKNDEEICNSDSKKLTQSENAKTNRLSNGELSSEETNGGTKTKLHNGACANDSNDGDHGNKTRTCNGAQSSDSNVNDDKGAANTNEKVYQLLDVEIDQPSQMPTFESLLKESQSADNITCNSVPLVKQTVSQQEEDYVYDLYYTNNQEFNFKALESDLKIQLYDDELIFADDRNFTNEEIYEDEDDSNDEDNWRNDYPDEDPHFYENEDAEYHYGDDDRDTAAFEHQDHDLAGWMSSRCNIEAGDVSDEEPGSSYDRYYHMVKQEVDQME